MQGVDAMCMKISPRQKERGRENSEFGLKWNYSENKQAKEEDNRALIPQLVAASLRPACSQDCSPGYYPDI